MKKHIALINKENKKKVLNLLHSQGPFARVKLSKQTGLSLPTIMRITDYYKKQSLINDLGRGKSTGGKPPKIVEFNKEAYYIIGVDIGTTNIGTILCDLSAHVLIHHTLPTNVHKGPKHIISRINESIEKVLKKSGLSKKKILGIGLGMPGFLYPKNGLVLFSPDFKWENIQLIDPIQKKFKIPVMMENVTRVMALGEKWFGAGQDTDNFLCINLGYGIGAAIMINGELYSGNQGSAGEFGHITLKKNGPLCSCGNKGCLEALSSANAMVKEVQEQIQKGRKSLISDMIKKKHKNLEAKTIFTAAAGGDRLAKDVISRAMEYLSIGIAGLINLMDPERIIVGGGLSLAGDFLFNKLEKEVNSRVMKRPGRKIKIIPTQLGLSAPAIGAACLVLKAFLENACELPLVNESVKVLA